MTIGTNGYTGNSVTENNKNETTSIIPAEVKLLKKTKYESRSYTIYVGFVKDGELPQYVVLNNETGVVEYNNEVLSFVREWVTHFQKVLDDLDSGKEPEQAQNLAQQASFN